MHPQCKTHRDITSTHKSFFIFSHHLHGGPSIAVMLCFECVAVVVVIHVVVRGVFSAFFLINCIVTLMY